MLNPNYNRPEEAAKGNESLQLLDITPKFNPFPGLRPFTFDECHLFFGREGQVDELLLKLAENRFVTIMGYSGSGKSSLVYCGLIPVLYGGFMTHYGPHWNIITTRPGAQPIDNLAESLLKIDPEYEEATPEELLINKRITASLLRSGFNGLVDAVQRTQKFGENTLIIVDQFEELFRIKNAHGEFDLDEAKFYVNLIQEACKSVDIPIHIVITMRSDHIGECAKFQGLTQMINKSNYLVPQMGRDQRRMAIEGPVAVGGGKVSGRLVKRLLGELGDNQDQLPILQHALMRTWDYWIEHREEDEPIDVRHYNAVGRMSHALSQHADEAYDQLSSEQQQIAEILFKSLTEKGSDVFGRRRAVKVSLVAQLAEVTVEEVIQVVDAFRQPGRSFLMPSPVLPLSDESLVEIAHESLMRIWTRLKTWVEEEHESAQMYKRLSEAAAMYQVGRTGLWRPPDLQLALNWQKKQKPTRAWAQRYDEAFERAIVFLDTSRITYEAEQRNQELFQKRLIKRTKIVALILGIAAVVAIVFLIFAYAQFLEADKQRDEADKQRDIAQLQTIEAKKERDEADEQRKEADLQRKRAVENELLAKENEKIAKEALADAQKQKQLAERNAERARFQKGLAEEQKQEAIFQTEVAEQQTAIAQREYNKAQKLLYQSVAQSMAVKSLNIEDKDLQGLLAKQAYQFNTDYEGRKFDPYIYNGLYTSMANINGKTYNTIEGIHRNSIRSIVFGKSNTRFYSTGTEGKIVRSSLNGSEDNVIVASNNYQNRVIKLSEDEKWLINASDSGRVQVFSLDAKSRNFEISGHQTYINDIEIIPGTATFLSSGGDGQLRLNSIATQESKLILNTNGEYKVLDVSPKGTYAVAGTLQGQAILINLSDYSEKIIMKSTNRPIHAVAFSTDGNLVAMGDEDGTIKIYDVGGNEVIREFKAHKGRVSDIEFSPNGGLVAAGSFDGTIQMWAMDELDELPIQMTDNDAYVWDLEFTPDSDYLLAACADGEIRTWATNPTLMAEDMCDQLGRNMTPEEWKTYVANDIGYITTCINLLLNDY
ncbi:MAG: hypothetical protein AAF519_02335 [Bacteroidota bacterium]